MSSRVDAKPIEASTRDAIVHFARGLLNIAAPIGVEAFAQGPARDEAVDLVLNADEAFGLDVAGRVATDVDTDGLEIGDAQIRTQLALFAQGKASSPIAEISLEKTTTIPLASTVEQTGSIAATCILTTILTYESADAEGRRAVNTMAKIGFSLNYTSPKKAVAFRDTPY